jgi:23S rRNA (uracil1939-C5)-methyltransferase
LNSLSKIGKIENIEKYNLDIEICPLEKQFGYRNKLQFPLSKDKETRQIFYGLYMNGTHSIVDIDKCEICSIEANELLLDFIKYANFEDLKIYDELEVLNGFRHISIRINRQNEAILTIVGTYDYDENNSQIKRIKRLSEKLFLKYQEKQNNNIKINGIIYAVNSKKTNFIFGDKFHTLIGKDEVIETFKIDDKRSIIYKISSASFFQVNTFIAEKLYQNIRSLIFEKFGKNGLKPKVLDLFCGSGGIGLFISDLSEKIIGIDVVEQSIENAEIAAADNNIDNAIYFSSKVEDEKILKYILAENPDVVIVNPPRKGIDEKVIKQIKKINPKMIIYVSCNPVSLARDLKIFVEDNCYFLDKVKAFDMFPQTSNVETLAILSKINI